MKLRVAGMFVALFVLPLAAAAQSPGKGAAAIQWFSILKSGLDEAKRTGKPILFVSAAPHCAGVSGIW